MSDELEKLLENVHQEITIFDFDGRPVPCIILDEKKYDEILSKIAGKPTSINTDLNILQDGLGHVFVEVLLTFSQGGIMEKMLVNANTDLKFFESLAQTSMIALSSPKSVYGKDNVFMIQLPKPEKAHDALEIIKKGLKQNNA
ncbi:MAG: hypothetical protein H2B05_03165 [Nitrosopumilaceae archaeon]|jgi:hypothetical protein|uniref:Uncharacterized protein n=1 Tax=Candidatus Nitrosomaritimum aestuariumsis TaxID=3342354 RepID=A0AC60W2X1_9ARCH|nr:hypothetical protein [Nitrosopumilaceae archaeon]NCF21470.1 hypothetical protein [Nitrosopumilaceae archaeon]